MTILEALEAIWGREVLEIAAELPPDANVGDLWDKIQDPDFRLACQIGLGKKLSDEFDEDLFS